MCCFCSLRCREKRGGLPAAKDGNQKETGDEARGRRQNIKKRKEKKKKRIERERENEEEIKWYRFNVKHTKHKKKVRKS